MRKTPLPLFILLLPLALAAASTATVRAKLSRIYKLQGIQGSSTISIDLPHPEQKDKMMPATVNVSGLFDKQKRLRIIIWQVTRQSGPETLTCYYDATGKLIYTFGTGHADSLSQPPVMWTTHWNAYWNGSIKITSSSWIKNMPGDPSKTTAKRKRTPYIKGVGWYATAAEALRVSGLKPDENQNVKQVYENGPGAVVINACSVSGRERATIHSRRLKIFDAGESVMVSKKGPAEYISGLGRFHWYQVFEPGPDNAKKVWVFGAFLEPTAMHLDMK